MAEEIQIVHTTYGDFKTDKGFNIANTYDIEVKVDGVSIVHGPNGELVANLGESYILPPATTTTIGGVIVGNDLAVDATGLLSVNHSTLGAKYVDVIGDTMTGSLYLSNPSSAVSVGIKDDATNSRLYIYNDPTVDGMGIQSLSYGVYKNILSMNRTTGANASDIFAIKGEAYLKAESDTRYLNTAGDTATGALSIQKQVGQASTHLRVSDVVDGDYLGIQVSDTTMDLYKYVAGIAEGAIMSVSRASGAVSSGTFYVKGEVYTKAESDARFEPIDSAYTKAESDSRFINTNETTTPIGGILPMATNTNPADIFPGTTWGYLAQDRYIMGGASGQATHTGGANSVGISLGNLPAVNLPIHFQGSEDSDSGDPPRFPTGDVYNPNQGTWEGANYAMLQGSGVWLTTTPQWTKYVFWKRNS